MRIAQFLAVSAAVLIASPAWAQAPARKPAPAKAAAGNPDAPKKLGQWDDWVAATHLEAGQQTCYAFTKATQTSPAGRGDVVLTVTERPTGRDAVAIAAGFTYPAGAEVTLQVDQAGLSFYTAQRSAFARDGAAVVAAFKNGKQAIARSNGPHNAPVADTFSLKGFAPAYKEVLRACPVPQR